MLLGWRKVSIHEANPLEFKSVVTGGVAGSVALTVVYPLDVIRRK